MTRNALVGRLSALACFCVLTLPLSARADEAAPLDPSQGDAWYAAPMDWPYWRGPEMNGISREKGLVESWSRRGENLLWRNEDIAGRSTPIVMNGRLYTIVNDEPRMAAMVSRSADGDLLVPSLRLRRVEAVRGSTRKAGQDKGGRSALNARAAAPLEALELGCNVIAPRQEVGKRIEAGTVGHRASSLLGLRAGRRDRHAGHDAAQLVADNAGDLAALELARRIGRAPQLGPPTGAADVPTATRILGAGKLSGRTGEGWALGVLNAVTAPAEARFLDEGEIRTMAVAPLTNHFVGRVRRDLRDGQSAMGGALTSVSRRLNSPALAAALHSSAWAGGLDFRHEWAERNWRLAGSFAGTHVRGSTDAITATQRQPHHYFQRPDADHLAVDSTATALTGDSAGISLARQAGEHWRGSIAAAATSPGYEANDLGFAMRTDRIDLETMIRYRQDQPGDFLRDWSVGLFGRNERTFGGDPILRFINVWADFRHLEFWGGSVFGLRRMRSMDDRSTRGGPIMVRPAETVGGVQFFSDSRRPVSVTASTAAAREEFGGDGWEVGGRLQLRTSPRWNASIGPYFSRGRVSAQYIATVADPDATATYGRRYLFAPLDFTHLRADVRLNATLAPRLTLELYAQPLIFSFDYDEVGALAAPRTYEFQPYDGPVPDLDTTLRSLRGNAVLRWEWRPGSTLFLVWQQSRQGNGDDGSFRFMDDARGLLSPRPDNIFVLKATYWLNP
jgi:hypothetical protein